MKVKKTKLRKDPSQYQLGNWRNMGHDEPLFFNGQKIGYKSYQL